MSRRAKAKFDILSRIRGECIRRGWTDYVLSQHSGVPLSTISSWYGRKLDPTVANLEKICDAFGITLSEFFSSPAADPETEFPDYLLIRERIAPEVWVHMYHFANGFQKTLLLMQKELQEHRDSKPLPPDNTDGTP